MSKRIIVIIVLSILCIGCVKVTDFQAEDEVFHLTHNDFMQHKNYKLKPLKNGRSYYYSHDIKNKFGLYSFYSVILIDEKGREVKWISKANKFYRKRDIQKLFKSAALMTKLYPDSLVTIDIDRFAADNGFCINDPEYFQFVITRGNVMLDLSIEGYHNMTGEMVESVIPDHLYGLENITLEKK